MHVKEIQRGFDTDGKQAKVIERGKGVNEGKRTKLARAEKQREIGRRSMPL